MSSAGELVFAESSDNYGPLRGFCCSMPGEHIKGTLFVTIQDPSAFHPRDTEGMEKRKIPPCLRGRSGSLQRVARDT